MNEGWGGKIPMSKGNERDFVRVHSVKTRMEARCCNGDKYVPGVVREGEGCVGLLRRVSKVYIRPSPGP